MSWKATRAAALVVIAVCIGFSATLAPANDAYSPEQQQALATIRKALAERSFADLDAKVEHAKSLPQSDEFAAELSRLGLLVQYVKDFWSSVDTGARMAVKTGEIKVDDMPISVVEFEQGTLTIRHSGQNKRYTRQSLPAKLALVLAELHIRPEVGNNRVFLGAFLAMDGKGDRRLAAQYWETAAKAGIDVADLLPELKLPAPKAPIVLPELTPAHQALLHPNQWLRLTKKGTKIEREAIGKLAEQNSDGRLVVHDPGEDESTLVFKTRSNGDFQCRMFLQDVTEGQQFGLYPGQAGDPPIVVSLPAGTVKVELQRKGTTLTCRINDADVPVELPKKSAARTPGHIGVSFVPGKSLTIAVFEIAGR